MTPDYATNLLIWEARRDGRPASPAPASIDSPTRLPTPGGNVTCISCHNPHDPSLFPADSELAVFATAPEDRAVSLRLNRSELCLVCHPK